MIRAVVWAQKAIHDMNRHLDHVARASPRNILIVNDRVLERVESLARTATGRLGRVPGTYEKFVPKAPLVICCDLPDERS